MVMDALDRKLLRDFRRLWVQALAIALVMAGGVSILLMSFGMSTALDQTRDTYYERNRFADVFASARRVPLSLMQDIRAIDGVASAEPRVTTFATLDLEGKTSSTLGYFVSLPVSGRPLLNEPFLRTGTWPDPNATDQIVVNEPFAQANSLRIGDTISANLNGNKRKLTITGTVLSPEFIYTIGPGSMVPDYEDYGIAWMPERALAAAVDRTGAFDNLTIKLRPGFSVDPVKDAVDDLLEPYGGTGALDRTTQTSNAYIDGEIEQLRSISYILPPIFLGITVFLVNLVIGRIVTRIRARWPEVGITLRADSGFAREELMGWCEANKVDFLFGLARNARLVEHIDADLARAAAEAERTGHAARGFADFQWSTRESWSRHRRVVAKAEWMPGRGEAGANPRFVVTSLEPGEFDARALYEDLYCARGDMENRIKECQLDLFADRTSAVTMRANQLRLWFASMAYVLLPALRRKALAGTRLARATCATIRLKLLKIGALVTRSVRRIRIAMASACPYEPEFRRAHTRLCP